MRHTAQSNSKATRFAVLVAVTLMAAGGVWWWRSVANAPPARTVSEVQQDYAQRFVEGMPLGPGSYVKAEGFDAQAGHLVSVAIQVGDEGLIHAKRAAIVIDPTERTMRLRLIGVTLAPIDGTLQQVDEMWTDATRLIGPVVAETPAR
jgi:hypothetical protein